ncbi:hypothetical protein DVH24_037170 [Malus domestica]|uniref:Uncharacterized protein n=1 Tax=Malus domestica TaxID=3750 RepID=A0A498HD50_MALDO|nr:hypothetical protein DVH24_037170 [Malus domestica]
MAGSDARKQLLNLINDFASEKSHGERRVVSLRKRIDELGSELEVANAELEEAKRAKEYTEQEIKGYEVELAMNEAAIQTLELRISHTQEEISAVGSEVEALKNKQAASRRFQESIAGHIHEEEYSGSAEEEDPKVGKEEVTEGDLRELEDMLAGVVSQATKAEEEYEAEQNTQKQVQQALSACRREVFLMEETLKATKETSELEQICATVGETLQSRCVCPSCHFDNVEVLGGLIQSIRLPVLRIGQRQGDGQRTYFHYGNKRAVSLLFHTT